MSDPSTLDPPPRLRLTPDIRSLGRGIVGADRGEDGMRLGLYFVVDTH